MTVKNEIYWTGYEAKKQEINGMGWTAARDKFNSEYPPGQKWCGSQNGLLYAYGEFQALCDTTDCSYIYAGQDVEGFAVYRNCVI